MSSISSDLYRLNLNCARTRWCWECLRGISDPGANAAKIHDLRRLRKKIGLSRLNAKGSKKKGKKGLHVIFWKQNSDRPSSILIVEKRIWMGYSPDDPYYRLGPVHTCLYVRACRLVTGTSFPVSWNGQGRRLVELTDGCYSGGDFQGLPLWIK